MSDTPISDSTPHNVAELGMLCRQLEREHNDGIDRIKQLIAERDTARTYADQKWKLREEFHNLFQTDDIEQGVAMVRDLKNHIQRLEEAGDKLHWAWSNPFDPAGETIVENWTKTKEAK